MGGTRETQAGRREAGDNPETAEAALGVGWGRGGAHQGLQQLPSVPQGSGSQASHVRSILLNNSAT